MVEEEVFVNSIDLKEIENIVGHKFEDKSLIELAFTHSSYSNEMKLGKLMNNERLEFLGDAVLELTTSEFLFTTYPLKNEGLLTKLRASMVCEHTLSKFAKEINLGKYLLLGKGEDSTGGRERASILSNTVEAIIGAIYLDSGYDAARKFIRNKMLVIIEDMELFVDSKTYLQETLQKSSAKPIIYEVIAEKGPDHMKEFTVEVRHGKNIIGRGQGKSKKSAEQEAANDAIRKLSDESSK